MAFFKLRKGGDEPAASARKGRATARQPESIEAMRQRAKHRLIGASVLVLIGVIGFPLVFDTQPRPISVDIPIEIPDRNKVKPLPMPAPAPAAPVTQAPPPAQEAVAAGVVTPAPAPVASVAKTETPTPRVEPKPEPAPVQKTEKAEAKPAPAPETKPTAPARGGDGAKALALLEGKQAAPAAAEGRFVVQVGAFSDVAKAREARLKLEHAGLKTYTQVVDTKDGKRIRVRVGPYGNKADADRAADKVKGLDLQAAVLTL